MRSYDEAWAVAKDQSAFSNGTEGDAWTSNWCERCIHDRSVRSDDWPPDPANNGLIGCALLAVALMGRTPVEWMEQDRRRLGDQYHCSEFRDENDGGDQGPPRWDPEMPGQTTIFDEFADGLLADLTSEVANV